MSATKVVFGNDTVVKYYRPGTGILGVHETWYYHVLPWATPALLNYGPGWIEIERCTPILDLDRDTARSYRDSLRNLLNSIHEVGFWHRDTILRNVVVHPQRGVLLIDWENATPATSNVSYDLYGARAAGVESAHPDRGPDGIWWGAPEDLSPGVYLDAD